MMKRTLPVSLLLVLSLLLVACGSANSTSTGSSNGYGGASGSTPTAAATAPATSAPVIKTATATVKGAPQTILTNAQGMTLYYFTPDTATTAACTGSCATTWPPVLFQGSGTPASATSLSGTLSVVSDGNGTQVEYNGHPLYTYSGDTAAGQTQGEGLFGKWFVATPDLQSQATPNSTPTSAPRGGY